MASASKAWSIHVADTDLVPGMTQDSFQLSKTAKASQELAPRFWINPKYGPCITFFIPMGEKVSEALMDSGPEVFNFDLNNACIFAFANPSTCPIKLNFAGYAKYEEHVGVSYCLVTLIFDTELCGKENTNWPQIHEIRQVISMAMEKTCGMWMPEVKRPSLYQERQRTRYMPLL